MNNLDRRPTPLYAAATGKSGRRSEVLLEATNLTACDHCDGTGEIWEPCDCFECEYDSRHARFIPCANCDGTGKVA